MKTFSIVSYDSWKTSGPPEDFGCCACCGGELTAGEAGKGELCRECFEEEEDRKLDLYESLYGPADFK